MNNNELADRMESLELRLMHLEAAMDELTHTLLDQEGQLRQQADTIQRLEALVKAAVDAGINDPSREPPPPHY